MGYIFVLYSSYSDQDFAQQLVSDLRQRGIDARSPQGELKPGWDWSHQATAMKINADIQLYILGQKTLNISRWVSPHDSDLMFVTNSPTNVQSVHFVNIKFEEEQDREVINFQKDYDSALNKLLETLPDKVFTGKQLDPIYPLSLGYIFISYAEEDTDFVTELRLYLKKRGYGYWDYQDSDRNYQTQLSLELEDVIKNAAATVSVLSPDWKQSTWAAKEYMFSEEVGKPVFLLMAREMGPTLVTAGVPYIDFVHNAESGFEKLDRELRRKGLI